MLLFLLRRLALAPLVLWVLVTISFFLVRAAPGGPFSDERKVPPAVEQALQERYHLDEPIWRQYGIFLADLASGDLGPSIKYPGRSVSSIILDRLPPTLILGGYALLLAIALGLAAGITGAIRQNTAWDYTAMGAALFGFSVPSFVVGPLLYLLFVLHLALVQPPGASGPSFAYLSIAAFTLALPFAARIARLARAGMLEVINEDFIRTARAKGLSPTRIILVHGLRGAIVPVVSFLGPAVASILTGSLVVEQIFQLKGLGVEFIASALNRDYFLVMGTVIVYGVLLLASNIVVDLCYGLLDPRVRYD